MTCSEEKKKSIETIQNWRTIELVGNLDIVKVIVAKSHMLMKVEERLSTLSRE